MTTCEWMGQVWSMSWPVFRRTREDLIKIISTLQRIALFFTSNITEGSTWGWELGWVLFQSDLQPPHQCAHTATSPTHPRLQEVYQQTSSVWLLPIFSLAGPFLCVPVTWEVSIHWQIHTNWISSMSWFNRPQYQETVNVKIQYWMTNQWWAFTDLKKRLDLLQNSHIVKRVFPV